MFSICKLWVEFLALNQHLKFCMRMAEWPDGRVGENNATGGPNSSAETELSWSVGAVYGNIFGQKLPHFPNGTCPCSGIG